MQDEQRQKRFENISRILREVAPYTGLGFQLAITVIVFWFIGRLIDNAYGTEPIWMIIGAVAGITVGMYNFIKSVIELNKKGKK
jgi:F0F1-type ATP synthase assembly protein I